MKSIVTSLFLIPLFSASSTVAHATEPDTAATLIAHSSIMCQNYAPEAAKDVIEAVRKSVGDDALATFVKNKYTLCPISRLVKQKAVWYSRHGALGYDRNASPADVAVAVSPAIKEFAKAKQGPDFNVSYDGSGTKLTNQVTPMFEPACYKEFRQCF